MVAKYHALVVVICLLRHSRLSTSWSQKYSRISYESKVQSSYELDRRSLGIQIVKGVLGGSSVFFTIGSSTPVYGTSVPKPPELERLQKGYGRVEYLLNNWDELTSVCGKGVMSNTERKQVVRTEGGGGGTCEKTPLVVQDFLGYKSTEDPLFKADKLMVRAAPLVDPDNFEDYLDTVEQYRAKADAGAMMAYTSSWGEANPNGGKEVIDDYLERTKIEVEQTLGILKKILGYLELDIPQPISKIK